VAIDVHDALEHTTRLGEEAARDHATARSARGSRATRFAACSRRPRRQPTPTPSTRCTGSSVRRRTSRVYTAGAR
jgi:hypothetical protein